MVGIDTILVTDLGASLGEEGLTRMAESARSLAPRTTAGIALAGTPIMAPYLQAYAQKVAADPTTVRPRDSVRIEPSLPTARMARALGLTGPGATFGGWPHGGWQALAWAAANIELGRTDQMLVGAWADQPSRIVWVLLGEAGPASVTRIADLRWVEQPGVAAHLTDLEQLLIPTDRPRRVAAAGGALTFTILPRTG